ncbi:MAG: aminotransferase class I/II-fold pyridoxal phosphate-dependent enzyme, partial [Abditibacteriota bacterium]|nr:aminotransferase class I/II-fold pyridoxal phosphate-dependent enzyme [Abditibacteriota bacterium]
SSVIEKVLKALPERCILVLDEAYYEFADDPSYTKSIEWVKEDKNVFVMRTFSKVYALAGIRVGYGVAAKRIIDLIERVRGPFNVNSVAQVGAVASLHDPDQLVRSREQIARSKAYIYKALEEMGIEYTPTQANFIWINVKKNCREVFQDLMKLGVIVRTGDIFGHPTYLRVTFGTDEQNERFIKSLKEVLK